MPPLLYRVFLRPLTVFLLLMAVFCAYKPVFAQNAADQTQVKATDPYRIKGVPVDVSADSALVARKKAFAEARRKAYEAMATQLLSAEQRPQLVVPDDRVIAGLVRDVEIVSEKMTSHRYVGVLDVRFNPQAVKRTMQLATPGAQPAVPVEGEEVQTQAQRQPLNPTDEYIYSPDKKSPRETTPASSARSILILPWYGVTGRQTLWGQGNPWRAAWEENAGLSRDKSSSIVLPVGDAKDMQDYAAPQPLSRNINIASLMSRYNANTAILAVAEPGMTGDLMVSLYRYEGDNPIPIGRFGVDSGPDILADAVSKSVASIKSLPPVEMAAPVELSVFASPMAGSYRTIAQFSNLQQWVAMRNILTRTSGINSMVVRSISPSQANIEFTYGGDVSVLVGSLAQNYVKLSPVPPGTLGDAQYMMVMER